VWIKSGESLMKTLYICRMTKRDESSLKVAEFLLQIKAIKLSPSVPYTWASGWKSPIYCDNRRTLSYPKIRTYIRQELVEKITEAYGKPDVIVGVATGGIAQGVLVAQELGVSFAYVRPASKTHGMQNRVEGVVEEGQSVVVIEDLISTGNSSLNAVHALREAGCKIKGMAAIFTYGFDLATANFRAANCPLITLTDYNTLISQALDSNYIGVDDLESLREWRKNPAHWGQNQPAQ
jgi:orotate phosphoribosyltransferase